MPGDDDHGVKQDKKRHTLLLTAFWMGEKEKPLMIWKSDNPRVLRGADKSKLPVANCSQGKAWMTIPLFKGFDSHKDVWVFRAWCKVNPRTISKCFAKCGFTGADDTRTAAVTADLSLPELAAGDTED